MLLCLNFQIFDSLCKKIDFLETLRMLVFCQYAVLCSFCMFAFICLRLESLHLPLSLYFLYFFLYFDIFVFISLVIPFQFSIFQIQFTLFLKEIGMPVHEALMYWRTEYSIAVDNQDGCHHDWKNNEKRYIYNIRHLYGLEGSRINYRSHCCSSLQVFILISPALHIRYSTL